MKFPKVRQLMGSAARTPATDPLPGQFQRYSHTLPDRYPWIFKFAAATLLDSRNLHLLSFGCSRGDEAFALRRYFPTARIEGIDVNPQNIVECVARAAEFDGSDLYFTTAANTQGKPDGAYDAIFCLAVLCLGDLTANRIQVCEPYITFEQFSQMVTDFARCLRPGGLLFLHTTNFRFCDTQVSEDFDVVLEADIEDMAADVLFDRNNKLMDGVRYTAVGFRKHGRAGAAL
jgi:SAM-dependent methyltransferase